MRMYMLAIVAIAILTGAILNGCESTPPPEPITGTQPLRVEWPVDPNAIE